MAWRRQFKFLAWSSIAQSVCQRTLRLLEILFQRPWFKSCIQQRKTIYLSHLSIWKSLACARASKLTTTNDYSLPIAPLGPNFSEFLINIQNVSFKKKWMQNCRLQNDDLWSWPLYVNSLRPRLNRRPFADDICKCIFLNENEWILPRIPLKFVPKVRMNNIPTLVKIMAWRRPGDKPLSEPMMARFLTHICVTRPQWLNTHNLLMWISMVASHHWSMPW